MKVSTYKVNISPKTPTYIGGHAMRKGKMKGIHDEIEAIILWLEIEGERCLFVNADLSSFDYDFIHEIKRKIINKISVKYDNIVISATHTHSGPIINTRMEDQPHDESYREYVMSQIVEGALKSYDQVKAFHRLICRIGKSVGFYGNRNSKEKYGDQNIYVLEFKDEQDTTIAAMVNLSCHATVLSPEEYLLSGDLLAALRRKLTPLLGVEPLMSNGNAGDISNRLYRQGNDFNELERVTQGIVDQISTFENPVEIELSKIRVNDFTFSVRHKMKIEEMRKKLVESEEKLQVAKSYDDRKWLISEIAAFKRKMKMEEVKLDFETSIIRIGELELVVLPCELVSAFGKQIKKSSNAKVCIVWGYANGQTGYVVEASEFDHGHDGISTMLPKGKAEEYVGKIIQHLF